MNGQAAVIGRYRNLQGIFYAGEEYDSLLFFNDADLGRLCKRCLDGTTTIFSSFSGKPIGITLDKSGLYGGRLYMSVTDPQENSSVFVVNPDGTASVFCSMTWILDLEFDTTSAGAFGGFLYGCRSSWAIGRISPEGLWTRFAFSGSADEAIKCLTFGPDNSMYVIEELAANRAVVLKISVVPEPTTFFLMVLGGLVLRKRAAG